MQNMSTTYFTMARDGNIYQHLHHADEYPILVNQCWTIAWSHCDGKDEIFETVKQGEMNLFGMVSKVREDICMVVTLLQDRK